MGILKLFYEEPDKLRLLIVNFIKLLLTILIVDKIFNHQSKWNDLYNLIQDKSTSKLDEILIYSATLIFTWFILWYIGESFFLFLISLRKKKSDAKSSIEKRSFFPILKMTGAYRFENGDYLPGPNIEAISELAESLSNSKKTQMKNTIFADTLFMAIVGWFYLLFNQVTFHCSILSIAIVLVILIILCMIYRAMDSLLNSFQNSSSAIAVFLTMMVYKKMVNNVLINIFNAKYNAEIKCFELEWGEKKYLVGSIGYESNEHGNTSIYNTFIDPATKIEPHEIFITNISPNQTLKTLLSSKTFSAYVVANNGREVMDNLLIALNQLDPNVK